MSKRILLAEDDCDNRSIMRSALEAAGFSVILARDGVEALDAAAATPVDLVLLDMTMPRLDGWDAAPRFQQVPGFAAPIIAYTAHAMAGDEVRTLEAGCDGYLAKPCSPRDAVAFVRGWLAKAEGRGYAPSALGR
ncbi:MAG: response regulator [Elusimicrobia bacterium]|nr:response regulator [Elusimicrobiota bacterium]